MLQQAWVVCVQARLRSPGVKLDGCAPRDETPAIGISGRWKRLGKVLFTILHEVEDYPRPRRSIASTLGNR